MVDTIVIGVSTGVDLLYRQLSELDVRPDITQELGEGFVIQASGRGHAGRIACSRANAVTDISASAAKFCLGSSPS